MTFIESAFDRLALELRHLLGKLLIVWDGLRSHRSRLVWDFVRDQRGPLWLSSCPAYAPGTGPSGIPLVAREVTPAAQLLSAELWCAGLLVHN